MNEFIVDKNKFKQLFSNATSRVLLGVWLLAKGCRFSSRSMAELISLSEDSLETKLQTFAGFGLVNVATDPAGERQIEFLQAPTPEIEKMIREFYESRKNDFNSVELKVRSLLYKTILTSTL